MSERLLVGGGQPQVLAEHAQHIVINCTLTGVDDRTLLFEFALYIKVSQVTNMLCCLQQGRSLCSGLPAHLLPCSLAADTGACSTFAAAPHVEQQAAERHDEEACQHLAPHQRLLQSQHAKARPVWGA